MSYFYWSFICKRLCDGDPIKMKILYKEPLQTILDYMVIEFQENIIKELTKKK